MTQLNAWKYRDPAADRRLWGEQRRNRGRKLVLWIGVPLLAVMIGSAGFAATHPRFHVTLPFGNDAPVPARHYANPAPIQVAEPPAAQPAAPKQSTNRRSR